MRVCSEQVMKYYVNKAIEKHNSSPVPLTRDSIDFIIRHIREEIQKHEERVKHGGQIGFSELDLHIQETVAKEFEKRDELEATLNNAGRPWTTEEDMDFRSSIDAMIRMLTGRHNRTEGAIVSRLRQKYFSKD